MNQIEYPWRMRFIWLLLSLAVGLVAWRLVDLNLTERSFLQRQGDARMERTVPLAAHRGMVLDRNGKALAVSAPVISLWAHPQELLAGSEEALRLAIALDLDIDQLNARLTRMSNKEFMYLRRQMNPQQAQAVLAKNIPGVYGQREFQRYYPAGEVATHLVGFNNVDDRGQEGLELAYEDWLQAQSGRKLVKKDRQGRTVEDLRILQAAQPGKDLTLSIDLRMQYVAYRELKAVVQSHQAKSAAAVILDVHTGEVLAMVNQPSYNPNNRKNMAIDSLRNRALTDVIEPGSTVKPLTVSAALMSGQYSLDSEIDTSPGFIRIKGKSIRDHRNYGVLDMTGIITKSSN
ncbi:MAG: penicillin-binding transpeptidase domain-containing protein, partial [Gammaproteobacteria bacterium]|nr:penicillin-binding transpeptidase domain-containing protein [Gammaproteobacteria bacterium]